MEVLIVLIIAITIFFAVLKLLNKDSREVFRKQHIIDEIPDLPPEPPTFEEIAKENAETIQVLIKANINDTFFKSTFEKGAVMEFRVLQYIESGFRIWEEEYKQLWELKGWFVYSDDVLSRIVIARNAIDLEHFVYTKYNKKLFL